MSMNNYVISGLKIGNSTSKKDKQFIDNIINNNKLNKCVIVGKLFEFDANPSSNDFRYVYDMFKDKYTYIEIVHNYSENSYTKLICDLLNIKIEKEHLYYKEGSKNKSIGELHYFNDFSSYLKNGEIIDNSTKKLEVKITDKTDLKKLKDIIVNEKSSEVVEVEIDESVKNIKEEKQTDLILLLNQDNVKLNKRPKNEEDNIKDLDIDILEDPIDPNFKPNKNNYIKLLISIINNKNYSENEKKFYINTLKKIY